MNFHAAFQRARHIWPNFIVCAARFGGLCCVTYITPIDSKDFTGSTFEEAFAAAGVQLA